MRRLQNKIPAFLCFYHNVLAARNGEKNFDFRQFLPNNFPAHNKDAVRVVVSSLTPESYNSGGFPATCPAAPASCRGNKGIMM
jgi:hypothetical protein